MARCVVPRSNLAMGALSLKVSPSGILRLVNLLLRYGLTRPVKYMQSCRRQWESSCGHFEPTFGIELSLEELRLTEGWHGMSMRNSLPGDIKFHYLLSLHSLRHTITLCSIEAERSSIAPLQ